MPVFVFQQLTGAPPDYYFGVPPLLTTPFVLALGSAVLTGGVVILAALALTWQLTCWNLLGFRA